jgi:hypothetical protein
VLDTYSHVLPDDDRAREINNDFFAPPSEPSAQNVPLATADQV